LIAFAAKALTGFVALEGLYTAGVPEVTLIVVIAVPSLLVTATLTVPEVTVETINSLALEE
jgi:hypothetical protein